MKIIFFGSSDFSIPSLKACLDQGHEVALVITTPDRKKGRGMKLQPTVVKQFALEKNLPVESPDNLKDPALLERAKNIHPDLYVVSSIGFFIPSSWLKVPKKYALNVHPSLLPAYRGAAPINWPIINGDTETGVSIMEVTKELDAGDIFHQVKFPLEDNISSDELSRALADISYDSVIEVLGLMDEGPLPRAAQDASQSSYARKLTKEDGWIDWRKSAGQLHNEGRGFLPWPTARMLLDEEPIQVLLTQVIQTELTGHIGELLKITPEGAVWIQTGEDVLAIERVKAPGKKEMSAADFIRGKRLKPGHLFKSVQGPTPIEP